MGRNWYSPKHFDVSGTKFGEMLVVKSKETGETLIAVFNDGLVEAVINAYFEGLQKGRREGEENLKRDFARLFSLQPQAKES